MANIVRVVIIAAFVCAISALPAMSGQEEHEKLVDLFSVDDVPQQDVEIASADAGQVRDKRTLFKVKKLLKFGHGYGGYNYYPTYRSYGYYPSYPIYNYPSYSYGSYYGDSFY